MITVDELKVIYGVDEDQDLLKVFGKKSKSTISKWRAEGVPAIVERMVRDAAQGRDVNQSNGSGSTISTGSMAHIDHHYHNGMVIDEDERGLLATYRCLSESQKKKVQRFAMELKLEED